MTTICALCHAPSTQLHDDIALCDTCAERVTAHMNKTAARLTRLQSAADKAYTDYQRDHDRAHTMAQAIPFGQPIIVGHHSEGRDRRYRARIENTFRRAFEALNRANTLTARAEAAAAHDVISSDDPLAIVKLQAKITSAKDAHARMKAANTAARKTGGKPFATYELTNSNANIKRLEQRLKELTAKRAEAVTPTKPIEEIHGDVRLVRAHEDNRLRLFFPGKPPTETIKMLKTNGFLWSPSAGAWQRQLNNASEWAAERVLANL